MPQSESRVVFDYFIDSGEILFDVDLILIQIRHDQAVIFFQLFPKRKIFRNVIPGELEEKSLDPADLLF